MKMKRLIVLLMAATMILSSLAVTSFAEDAPAATPEGEPTVAGLAIPFGVYEPAQTELYDSGKVKILCEKVHVTNKITAEIAFTSTNYTEMTIGETKYEPYVADGRATFIIPIKLGEEISFNAHTTSMGGKDIDYGPFVVDLDKANLKPAADAALQDGFYTTEVNTNKATYGWKLDKNNNVQEGFSYPGNDYSFPVTVEVKDGKIASVQYTQDPYSIIANTGSDINYLMWAMDGHNVTDDSYKYLDKKDANYDAYHLDPHPAKNGKGMAEQFVGKSSIAGVDSVTAATITSRAIIDSVDSSLIKSQRGQKDDPAPVLPQPDTTPNVVPEDGYYTIKGRDDSFVGADIDTEKDSLMHVANGKIFIDVLYIQQRQASYPYLFVGTEAEALAAGEAGWAKPDDYDYGYKYAGSIYSGLEIKSLDKPQLFVMFAKSSGNWFNRPLTIKSSDITRVTDAEAEAQKTAAKKSTSVWKAKDAVSKAEALDTTYNTDETKAAITTAVNAVKPLLEDEKSTAEQIDQAVAALNTVVKDAKAEAAVKENEAVTAEANTAVEESASIVSKKTGYTASTYKAFEAALKDLKDVLAKEGVTTEEIKTAKAAYDEAVAALKAKQAQKLTVNAVKKTLKVKNLKKKAASYKAVKVSGNKGKVSYSAKATGKSKKALKFKNGKITVKKGTKKGTYKMTVTVKAAATDEYKAASKKVTVSVKVK